MLHFHFPCPIYQANTLFFKGFIDRAIGYNVFILCQWSPAITLINDSKRGLCFFPLIALISLFINKFYHNFPVTFHNFMPLPTFSLLLVFSCKFCEILIFQYILLFVSYAIYYLLKNPAFYYLPKFSVVHVYLFRYFHTSGNISFNFLFIILRSRSCCHLPYIIGAITIKNGYILLLTTVPCCACLLLSIFWYHWYNFVYFVNLHFTFHMLLPLAIVSCHLPYSIGTLTLEMLEFLILTLPVVHVYRFPYMLITT